MVRLIDQLEQRGLVTRSADPTDRRRHRIELTPAGRDLLDAVIPTTREIEAAHLSALSPAERRTLARLLGRVLDSQDKARERLPPRGQGRNPASSE